MSFNANFKKGTGTVEKSALQINAYGDMGGDLPVASADTLGGVKVGEGLSITEAGVLSASGGGIQLIEYTEPTETTAGYIHATYNQLSQMLENGIVPVLKITINDIDYYFMLLEIDYLDGTSMYSATFAGDKEFYSATPNENMSDDYK